MLRYTAALMKRRGGSRLSGAPKRRSTAAAAAAAIAAAARQRSGAHGKGGEGCDGNTVASQPPLSLHGRLAAMERTDAALSDALLEHHKALDLARLHTSALLQWIDGCAQVATLTDGEVSNAARAALRTAVLAPITSTSHHSEKAAPLMKHLRGSTHK
jgi:hypothetical protein